MNDKYTRLKNVKANINFAEVTGQIDFKNHSFGIGGVNPAPMPDKIIKGMAKLKPGLIRIFIQEFFFIEKSEKIEKSGGALDFGALDKYMRAINATGADIMASICIKPPSVYPVVDENIWRPTDVSRWQYIISELVRRYSIKNKYVTHWGVANEINIGEWGGCPYKIDSAADYFEYYKMTVEPILQVFPEAKVGGPSYAGMPDSLPGWFEEFIGLCEKNKTQLDFISFNNYSDTPEHHVDPTLKIKEAVDKFSKFNNNIELYITELNVDLGGLSLEERAYTSLRASSLGATIIDFHKRAKFINTFQYHIYDQFCDPADFAPFYARTRYMAEHWNDAAHRLGLFDEYGAPRPQYFLYSMLYSMARTEVAAQIEDYTGLKIIASNDDRYIKILIINYNPDAPEDLTLSLKFKNAREGKTNMKVYKIDDEKRWDINSLEFIPAENRTVYLHEDFYFNLYAPAGSVVMAVFDYDI